MGWDGRQFRHRVLTRVFHRVRRSGRDFCSGHDLGTPLETNDPLVSHAKENGMRGDYERWYSLDLEACSRWRNIRKPVICAAKGFTIYHGAAVMSVAWVEFCDRLAFPC